MALIVVKSNPLSLIPEDIKSVLTGACIAGAGAALTFFAENWSGVDLGVWTGFVAAGVSVLVNLARKYLSTTKYAE